MKILSVAAVLLLAACAAPPTAPPPKAPPPPTPVAVACDAAGGSIRAVCRMQRPMCVRPYRDAGKVCTDDDQCSGGCLHDGAPVAADGTTTGVCRKDDDPCGCVEHVVKGKKAGGICVD